MPAHYKVVYNHIPTLTPMVEANARKAIGITVREAETHMKRAMRAPKSGRSYRRGSIKRQGKSYAGQGLRSGTYAASGRRYYIVGAKVHRASAPGEAPAIDLGAYINSWFTRWTGKLTSILGTNAVQARALENGNPRRNLAARPHLGPAVDSVRDRFQQRMKRVFR